MARERMVTRTVEEAEVCVMYVDVTTQEVGTATFHFSATIGENKILSYIQKNLNTATMKYVSIVSYTVTEVLYGMPEQEFIARATVLPPRTTATTPTEEA